MNFQRVFSIKIIKIGKRRRTEKEKKRKRKRKKETIEGNRKEWKRDIFFSILQ